MKVKVLLIVIGFSIVGLSGCKTQADRGKLANDKMKFDTALQVQDNAIADQLHEEQVEGVRIAQGELAAVQR